MVKLILVICVVLLCSILGIKKAKKFENREQIIRESISLFKRVENDIKYTLNALPNAIEIARQDFKTEFKDVLGNISVSLLDNSYTEETIIYNVDELKSLKSYDKQILSNGLISLGKTDIETQISLIDNTINTLTEILYEAKDEKMKNTKLYRTIGLVAGMMIAIVII
ncbi:MAG: stage III sporulation protein AB [Clostridia bacterium]|nr:stage III sporulation protein AB [Clostridia bacterium]